MKKMSNFTENYPLVYSMKSNTLSRFFVLPSVVLRGLFRIISIYFMESTAPLNQLLFTKISKVVFVFLLSVCSNSFAQIKQDRSSNALIIQKSSLLAVTVDLSLEKNISNPTPPTGAYVTYWLNVTNGSNEVATNVEVNDTIPDGLQLVNVSGGDLINMTNNRVTVKINEIKAGKSIQFQIITRIMALNGTIKNFAQITKSDQKDPDSTPNNGVLRNEDDDDDAELTISTGTCNVQAPLIVSTNTYICQGESTLIEAAGCSGTVIWSDGNTGKYNIVSPNVNTSYTAKCQLNSNCVSGNSNQIQIVLNTLVPPTIRSSYTSSVVCDNRPITLTANGCSDTVLWSTGQTGGSIIVSPSNNVSYWAFCQNKNCKSIKSNTIAFSVNQTLAAPVIATTNAAICAGQKTTLTATGCLGTVIWSNGLTGNAIEVSPTIKTDYTAICRPSTSECLSANSNTITISVNCNGESNALSCLGVGLSSKIDRQKDGSFDLTYIAIIKNCGTSTLANVQLCDTLKNTFVAANVAKIVKKPFVNTQSKLKVDTTFNGDTQMCMLLSTSELDAGRTDTIKWIINFKLLDNQGSYQNNVVVSALDSEKKNIQDVSNAGLDPNPKGNAPLIISFNIVPQAIIGLAKDASKPKLVNAADATYDLTFSFVVKNLGNVSFTKVQVEDDLSTTFGDGIKIDSIKIEADKGFEVNKKYTGFGKNIGLLVDSLSTLNFNESKNIKLYTRFKNTPKYNRFENIALVTGHYDKNKKVDDLSTSGINPDPDGNGNPKDNSVSTSVLMNFDNVIEPFFTTFGIAKEGVLDSLANPDGTYNLAYKIIIKNYGTEKLSKVQLTDSLGKVFGDSMLFVIAEKPLMNKSSRLLVNTTFNGKSDANLLLADSSSLAVGASDTLKFKIRLKNNHQEKTSIYNSIFGKGFNSKGQVIDYSESGANPDSDGDKNPGNNNKSTINVIESDKSRVDSTLTAVIPQAFSPNDDGVNDLFVIKEINGKTNLKAEFYVYNRWGLLVYQNQDFAKIKGWNGQSNVGVQIGNNASGLPDGTYYYFIKADGYWNNLGKIDYLTIAR